MKRLLSKNDLLECKYEGIKKGWTLYGEKLPQAVETEIGLLNYMMGEGYVIIPRSKEDELEYRKMEKLDSFIKRHGVECRSQEVIESMKKIEREDELEKAKNEKLIQERLEEEKRLYEMFDAPKGYFVCWECGRTRPNEEMRTDGTCGC